jgi:hypothetical protein
MKVTVIFSNLTGARIGIDTGEHVVTLLAEHTILWPGGRPHMNFHICVLHLKNIHTIPALQNLLGCTPLSSAIMSFQFVS